MVLGSYYLTYGPGPEELEALEEKLRPASGTRRRWASARTSSVPRRRPSCPTRPRSWSCTTCEYRPPWLDTHRLTTVGRIIFNDKVERALEESLGDAFDRRDYAELFVNESLKKRNMNQAIENLVNLYGPYAIALVLDAFKDLGFHFASQAGITISKNDVVVPPEKEQILEKYEAEVAEIQEQYDSGLITQEERHEAVVEKWTKATDEVGEAMQDNLHELNPIFMMANSGARGSFKQIRQLAGMRGLMANPKGEIIKRPIKANFMEGLWFSSTSSPPTAPARASRTRPFARPTRATSVVSWTSHRT